MTQATLSALLAERPFIRFWLARLAAVLAQQMLMVAVAWQMYDLTGSAWDLGLVGLFQFVPALLLTLPAGHLVDKLRRGRIFALCMLVQSGVALLLVLATEGAFISRELILGLSILLGAARAFQMPSQQALLPMLVPTHLLERAVTLGSTGMQAGVICGPALGGLIYAAGPAWVYGVAGGLLLIAFGLMLSVHDPFLPSTEPTTLASVLAGVQFVWQNKLLLGATSLDLFAVLLGGATALLPIYARDILHVGPAGLGLLRGAPAAGALLMSLLMLRWPIQRQVGRWLLGSVGVFGLATVVFGLSEHFGLSLLALAITGAFDNISVVMRMTLVQLETPNEIRGRVSAVNSIFIGASNQLGEFESGATAALFGAVGSVVLGGVGTLAVAAGWFRLFPALARRDRMLP
ncbi:MFS transporter [Dechloromonas denitrificans]|uniref:MFS transporter n=1 Tax=Dechloromonas denitrificans TaxID=281362 RepID=A0A133XMB8_9RHOO|nr:MFS transporter [Dechloromonas denitrificans]KXB32083.1 MFS transporter [Dechloromonas denitrificans]